MVEDDFVIGENSPSKQNTDKSEVIYEDDGGRDVDCISFIGFNRTGKTSMAKQAAYWWKEANPEGCIITFDAQRKFNNLKDYDIHLHQRKEWIDWILDITDPEVGEYPCCLLILDDYRNLHPSPQPDKNLLSLLSKRTDNKIDIIYTIHAPNLVLSTLGYYTNYYYIFYNLGSGAKNFDDKIPVHNILENASRMINAYVTEFGKGEYPYFPHFVVDVENQSMVAQNIQKSDLKYALEKHKILV